MLKPTSRISIVCVFLVLGSLRICSARIVTVRFTAEVTEVAASYDPEEANEDLELVAASFNVGDLVEGVYAYDTSLDDLDGQSDQSGLYRAEVRPCGIAVWAHGLTFQTDPEAVSLTIVTTNDRDPAAVPDMSRDEFVIWSEGNRMMPDIGDLRSDGISVALGVMWPGDPLADDALPISAPVLDDWDTRTLTFGVVSGQRSPHREPLGSFGSVRVTAALTSATLRPDPAHVLYAQAEATVGGDGLSWASAFASLQDAIASVPAVGNTIIRVAQGTYRPDLGRTVVAGDREAAFGLFEGLTIQGGYAGSGAVDPNARDVETCRTILTGDLAGNDTPLTDPWSLLEDDPSRTDNSYCVVTVRGTDPNTTLAGFVVTGSCEYVPGGLQEPTEQAAGLRLQNGARIQVQECTFCDNVAPGVHGGEWSQVVLADCLFAGNVTSGSGAGLLSYCRNADVVRCTFQRNHAPLGGAGIYHYNYYGFLRLQDCVFVDNTTRPPGPDPAAEVPVDGGGGLFSGSSAELIGCRFLGNTAGIGGAVSLGGFSTLRDCTFRDNRAVGLGGAAILQGRISDFAGCVFAGNAGSAGGAVHQWIGEAYFSACLFSGNRGATAGGGAIRIDDNPSDALARMPIRPTAAIFTNCTFAGNAAPEGRAIWLRTTTSGKTDAGAAVLSNCIVDNGGDEIYCDQTLATITYSNVRGGRDAVVDSRNGITWGPGNIDLDPLFADAGYWDNNATLDDPNDDIFIEGDYHLKSLTGRWDPAGRTWVQDDVKSPCIDAGDPNSPVMYEPDPNGGIINLGAYGGTAQASKS